MNFEAIRVAVESHMAAWTGAPIAFDGVPASPAVLDAQNQKTPWVRLSISHGDSFTASIGAGPKVRRTGVIFVQVFTALDSGSRPAMLLADSLAEHLEYFTSGQIETQAATLTRLGPTDGYYMVNVSCGFRAG